MAHMPQKPSKTDPMALRGGRSNALETPEVAAKRQSLGPSAKGAIFSTESLMPINWWLLMAWISRNGAIRPAISVEDHRAWIFFLACYSLTSKKLPLKLTTRGSCFLQCLSCQTLFTIARLAIKTSAAIPGGFQPGQMGQIFNAIPFWPHFWIDFESGKVLMVAEKPSVAKLIAEFLSGGRMRFRKGRLGWPGWVPSGYVKIAIENGHL